MTGNITHPAFRLELVVDQFAIYFNPGDDVRVVDLDTKKLLENDIGTKKYNEIMDKITFEGKGYEFGSVYVKFAKQNRVQFHKKHTLSEQIKSASSRANEAASSASTKTKVQESQR